MLVQLTHDEYFSSLLCRYGRGSPAEEQKAVCNQGVMADVRRGGSTLFFDARLGVYLQRRLRANLGSCTVVEPLQEKPKMLQDGTCSSWWDDPRNLLDNVRFFAFLTRGATAWIPGNANRYGSMGLGKHCMAWVPECSICSYAKHGSGRVMADVLPTPDTM